MSPSACLQILATASALIFQDGASTAGYARSAWRVERGEMPRSNEVVVSDLIDYHRHSLPLPKAGEPVALDVRCLSSSTEAEGEAWLEVGIATTHGRERADLPPLALVLAVDCSGSMADDGKMETVHKGLRKLVERLRPEDRLGIVGWSDEAQVVLPLARVGDGGAARRAIEELQPTGRTNLEAGLRRAFELLRSDEGRPGTARRVILLTDGIANEGITDPEEILAGSRCFRERGLDLATIGVGADLNHELLTRLARGGHGLYHFVSDLRDLERVFVEDLQALVVPVASRVRLDVELPCGLRVDKVYGHPFERTRSGFTVRLDDLNGGMTQVVIARLDAGSPPAGELRVGARLSFEEAGRDGRRTCSDATTLRLDRCDDAPEIDPEVKKNVAIALLADALHEAACAAEEGSTVRARHLLDDALARVRGGRRNVEDEDLARIVELVRQARTAVAPRSDCDESRESVHQGRRRGACDDDRAAGR
jgi:Ca-activated chloride channel homolog